MTSRHASGELPARIACLSLLLAACANDGAALVTPDASAGAADTLTEPTVPPSPVGGLGCDEIVERWRALLAAATMVSCASDEECLSVGGSGGCGCGRSIAGCGTGVNAAAFQASDGPSLASRYVELQCAAGGACDCGTVRHPCVSGICQSSPSGCTMGGVPAGS